MFAKTADLSNYSRSSGATDFGVHVSGAAFAPVQAAVFRVAVPDAKVDLDILPATRPVIVDWHRSLDTAFGRSNQSAWGGHSTTAMNWSGAARQRGPVEKMDAWGRGVVQDFRLPSETDFNIGKVDLTMPVTRSPDFGGSLNGLPCTLSLQNEFSVHSVSSAKI